MKKLTALLLALVMVFSLVACSTSKPSTSTENSTSTETNTNTETSTDTSDETSTDTSDETSTDTSDENSTEASVEPITLRIGYMPNYASLWGVLSAMNTGAFEEEGITIDLWEFADGPSEVAAMEGGSIDLAYIGKGAHTLCIQGRAIVFAPSSVHTSDKIVVSGESGINSIEDLAGKRIAFNSGSSSESTMQSALTQAGLTEADVQLFDMDVSYMVSAMVSGTVDCAVAWNPYTTEILNQVEGSKEIEFSNGSINMSSWICLPDYAEENHDILVRFSRALYKGMDYGSNPDNWEEVAQWCADRTKTSLEANLAQTGDATWFDIATLTSTLQDGTMEGYYDHLQQDFLDGESITEDQVVDMSTVVLYDVMKEALGI